MGGYFKQLLATDRLIRVFCSGRLVHPISIQLFGLSGGYDGFWLDAEHAGISTEQITMAALTGRACGLGSFVRMPVTNYAAVTQALESGVDGVMAAQAGSQVPLRPKNLSPGPNWRRGACGLNTRGPTPISPASHKSSWLDDANRDHFLAIQIETLGRWKRSTRSPPTMPSTCCLSVRPILSSVGRAGIADHEKVWAAIDRVAEAAGATAKVGASAPAGPDFATRCIEKGCRMLTFGSDVMAMRMGVEAVKKIYAAGFD